MFSPSAIGERRGGTDGWPLNRGRLIFVLTAKSAPHEQHRVAANSASRSLQRGQWRRVIADRLRDDGRAPFGALGLRREGLAACDADIIEGARNP
jgi:hypothetical protein